MCIHHWEIDSVNQEVCKLCGKPKDFQKLINEDLGIVSDRPSRSQKITGNLNPTGGYYLQGHYSNHRSYRKSDRRFSLDEEGVF